MRTLLYLSLLIISSSTINAQSSSDVVLAIEHYESKSFEKAKEHIDLAVKHKKSAKKSKTWYYRGKIYFSLATTSETPTSSGEKLSHFTTSATAFEKAKSLDKKYQYKNEIRKTQYMMNSVFLTEGVMSFNAKDFTNAASYFELSINAAEYVGVLDTLAFYNAGLAYEKLNQVDNAIAKYQACADVGYKGGDIYYFMYALLRENQRAEESKAILAEGRIKYPNHYSLLTTQLNHYLLDGNNEQALILINKSIEYDSENEVYFFTRATIKESLDKTRSSIVVDYQKAIDLKSNYFDPNYNLGAYYYNVGVDIFQESSESTDPKEIEAMDALGHAELELALPYLERAYELKPNDRRTMESLKMVYALLEMTDKFEEIKKKLEN